MTDKTTPTKEERLQQIGAAAWEAIADLIANYNNPYRKWTDDQVREALDLEDDEEVTDRHRDELADEDPNNLKEDAERAIEEDPLEIQYCTGWYSISEGTPEKPKEFYVLITTGGPAVRIMGEFDQHGNITRAYMQVQDWFTPWVDVYHADQDTLIRYCEIVGVGAYL